jgi:hypothetical protein
MKTIFVSGAHKEREKKAKAREIQHLFLQKKEKRSSTTVLRGTGD